jgi:hypothetical protein
VIPRSLATIFGGERLHEATPFICLYLIEWSDAFEPSISTKSNRGSIWVKSITISPKSDSLHSFRNTYPLAIGYDSVSHESVESIIASDLKEFREGKSVSFYHGGLKHNVIVYLDLLASLQVQPERRFANYIMLGGSTYTACRGRAIDISSVASCVASCASCEFK